MGDVRSMSDPPYLLDGRCVYLLFKYPYQLFHARLGTPLLRASISMSLGVLAFVVGLAVAEIGSLVSLYVSTPAIYLLCCAFAFYMGRAEWMYLEMFEVIKHVRGVFLVSDANFKAETQRLGGRLTDLRVTLPLTALLLIASWSAIASVLLVPLSPMNAFLSSFEPALFPIAWFTGPSAVFKMLVLDWYATLAIVFTVNVAYGTTVCMMGIPPLIARWAVVPVPAYLPMRLQRAANFLYAGAAFYAIGVFALVVLYEDQPTIESFSVVSVFVIIGLLVAFTPTTAISQAVNKARLQLGIAVSETYHHDVFPFANGEPQDGDDSMESNRLQYSKLLELQELMQAASAGRGIEQQIGALIPTVLSQGLPYLGLFVATYLRMLH